MREEIKKAMALGWAIKTFRTRPSIRAKQIDLSISTGISINRIASIETGRVTPTDHEIRKIGKAIKVPAEKILKLAEAGNPIVE